MQRYGIDVARHETAGSILLLKGEDLYKDAENPDLENWKCVAKSISESFIARGIVDTSLRTWNNRSTTISCYCYSTASVFYRIPTGSFQIIFPVAEGVPLTGRMNEEFYTSLSKSRIIKSSRQFSD